MEFLSIVGYYVFFFFSSRRRHTRLQGDWSSDVCSSDLNHAPSPQAIENYDAMLVLADAIARAKSTDGKAIIAALEKPDIVLGRGRYTFSTSREPDWAYHQFMNAPVALLQFDKANQDAEDAPIIWPRDIADVKYTYLKPGQ